MTEGIWKGEILSKSEFPIVALVSQPKGSKCVRKFDPTGKLGGRRAESDQEFYRRSDNSHAK